MARTGPVVGRNIAAAAKGTQIKFRAPGSLHEQLEKAAKNNGWGISEEIRQRLEGSFDDPMDPRFDGLLAALRYAAAASARMFPARRVTVSRNVARQLGAEDQEVEDTTAHRLFGECLMTLLDAFEPAGIPASLPTDHDASHAELQRRADRIIGAALGSLGDRGVDALARARLLQTDAEADVGEDKP